MGRLYTVATRGAGAYASNYLICFYMYMDSFRAHIIEKYKDQPTFQQAVLELLEDVIPYLESVSATPADFRRLKRLLVPERIITFKVLWEDDNHELQYNIGYRVQFNSSLGVYKGGLRFDPSVNEDILKFLGFEQIFKNALTGLPLGAGKGGSDFDPKGKSDSEIRRFCISFMTELYRHMGPNTDVPAGDIGVGEREVGYLYGAYKQIVNRAEGSLTGKGVGANGSYIRTEATGYGVVYFVKEMLVHIGETLVGKHAVISGSGNVATHVAEKLIAEGGVPLTLSDREGYVYGEHGITREVIEMVKEVKHRHGSLREIEFPEGVTYHEGTPWKAIKADLYIPSATQNEILKEDAEAIVANGARVIAEAANMPSTLEAIEVFHGADLLFAPSKAVNAGGVAVSGLEMAQNAAHTLWGRDEVDQRLKKIMEMIHATCVRYGQNGSMIDYAKGANIGGFVRVFEAMRQLGW